MGILIDTKASARFDAPPKTLLDVHKFRSAIVGQSKEISNQVRIGMPVPKVKCPCGRRPRITHAHLCFHCGIYFCKQCSLRHFGPPLPSPMLSGE